MLGPTTWAVEKRGSSTVNVAGSRIDLQGEVAPRHEPRAERRNPRDRLVLPQSREHRMGIVVELGERDGGTEGER